MSQAWTWVAGTLLAGVLMIGCSRERGQDQAAQAPMAEAMVASPPAPPAVSADKAAFFARDQVDASVQAVPMGDQLASSATTFDDGRRRFVRTASARFRVRDTYAAALAIEALVQQQRGFVVSNQIDVQVLETQRRSIGQGRLLELAAYTVNGRLTVRVPSENTQALLRALAGQVEFLDTRRFEANDVQFDLLEQALAQQRGEQAQEELGAASARAGRADHVAEVIQARSQARERRDLALVEQRRTEDRIAFSTLTLSLYQPSMLRRTELPDLQAVLREHAPSFRWRLGQSLLRGWEGLQALLLRLAVTWPLCLLLVALAIGGRALLRHWRHPRD